MADLNTDVQYVKGIGEARAKALRKLGITDLRALMEQLPQLELIVTTGQKATETLCTYFAIGRGPRVGASVPIPDARNADGQTVSLYRLPSSSRAYPLSFDKKAAAYREMFRKAGVVE